MTTITSNHIYLHKIDKITSDLEHLRKLGEIISIELDLNQGIALSSSTLTFIHGTEGFYYLSGDIFINFTETTLDKIRLLLNYLFMEYPSFEILESIVVHMRANRPGRTFHFDVEISDAEHMPTILSVEDKSIYFQFLQSFTLLWQTTR